MSRNRRFSARPSGPGMLMLAAASALLAGGFAFTGSGEASSGAVTCQLRMEGSGSASRLTGIVHAKAPVDGSYRLRVTSSGNGGGSNITQSGEFSATPGVPATLGVVSLGGGGTFQAELQVSWSGGTVRCTR